MGVVHGAGDLMFRRTVVLKYLPRETVASDADWSRLVHEARAVAVLLHPTICLAYEIGESEDRTIIVMACLEGRSLLEIDSGLAEAHVVLGAIKLFFERDWVVAERELKSAIEIDPNDAMAHQLYAYFLELMGRPNEALAEIGLPQEMDPLSLVINCDVGIRYYFARQYDQAINQYLKTLEMDPNLLIAHIWLARAYEQKGMYTV